MNPQVFMTTIFALVELLSKTILYPAARARAARCSESTVFFEQPRVMMFILFIVTDYCLLIESAEGNRRKETLTPVASSIFQAVPYSSIMSDMPPLMGKTKVERKIRSFIRSGSKDSGHSPNSAFTNCTRSNILSWSMPSPTPMYRTGMPNLSLMPITTPPLAVPSSLVMASELTSVA